mgnify:CR=1 FL=1
MLRVHSVVEERRLIKCRVSRETGGVGGVGRGASRLGRFRAFRLGGDRCEGDQIAHFWLFHVLGAVFPFGNVASEEHGVGARHQAVGHCLGELVCRLVRGAHVVEHDCPQGDVLACVVKVDVEVLNAALVRVVVAQCDYRGVVFEGRSRCGLRLV